MSNRPSLAFGFSFQGDGSSTSVSISVSTGPIVYYPPSGSSTPALSGSLSVSAAAVAGVTCSGDLTVSGATILLGVLTVNFSTAPAEGSVYSISGTMLF